MTYSNNNKNVIHCSALEPTIFGKDFETGFELFHNKVHVKNGKK